MSCITIPTRLSLIGRSVTRIPSKNTSPLSGLRIPATILSKVLFPLPLGPIIQIYSPSFILSVTPSSAIIFPYRLCTSIISILGIIITQVLKL